MPNYATMKLPTIRLSPIRANKDGIAPAKPVAWKAIRGWHACPPLLGWREDDPTLLPVCMGCGDDVRVGSEYAIGGALGLTVICRPCAVTPGMQPEGR